MSSYVNKKAQGVSDKVLKSLRLPSNFVEEVAQKRQQEAEEDAELGNRFNFVGLNKGQMTRKAKRKMAKKEKKIKKQQHHLRKMGKFVATSSDAQVGNKRKRDDDEEIDSDIDEADSIEEPPKKKVRFAAEPEEREFERDPPVQLNKKQKLEQKLKEENKFIKSLNKNEPESEEPSEEEDTSDLVKLYDRTRAEEDERDLRMLEKKLGLKKGRKIGDGLDDLLAGITSGGGAYKVKTNKKIVPTDKTTFDWEELLEYDSDSERPQEIPRDGNSNSDEDSDEEHQEFDEENFDDEDLQDDEDNIEDEDDMDEGDMNEDVDNMDDEENGEFNSEELAAFDDENRDLESDEENGEFDEEDEGDGENDEEDMDDEEGDEEADEDEMDEDDDDAENGDENSTSNQDQTVTNTKVNADTLAGSTMKYIPPHLRRATEQNQAYKRELRGHVNRLADTNMIKTLEAIEQLYSKHPRSEMNETLSEFILADCSDPTLLFTSNALLNYSALVASLHCLIGIEVGGHFIDKLAKRFNQFYKEKNTKLCKNLLIIFIHLYNFEIINPSLLFDLTNVMIEHFNEEDIELLLVLVKHAGSKLRSDDPASVKEMLVNMYTKASNYKKTKDESKKKAAPTTTTNEEEIEESKRIDFMIDMLMDLKNNKMRLVIDKEANVHLNNLKRTIKNYMKQRGKENIDEVRISWKDLTAEETKGRWWLIGSGWSRASSGVIGGSTEQEAPVTLNMNEYDAKLLEVARKQRMNTDVRRAIFCIVMGSEDYLDAFEKLVRLGLKNKQEREIVFVIIHCCSMEKKFNPFYAHLAMKLCSYSHNFKFTFKFTFWDKFKDFENLQLRAISNLANLLAQLIGHHVLSLAMLKVVSFESIEPKGIVFFKIFMVSLMNDFEVETVMAVFQRLAAAPKTKQLKEGLDLFFMQIFTKNALAQITDEAQRKREERASKVAKMAKKAMRDKQVSLF